MGVKGLLVLAIFTVINYLIIILLLKNWIKKTIKKSTGVWWGYALILIGIAIMSQWRFSLLEHGIIGFYINMYIASLFFSFCFAIAYITDRKGKIR
ncbi:hypothetical protein [Alkaliphilus crotonatoxidans]